MALVLIFAGSFLGLFAGVVQVVLHGAPIWQGVLIYLGCAFLLPLAIGSTRWMMNRVMPQEKPATSVSFVRN
ncbi:hypothetical protein [Shimia biformata]|uniref:hypothetical protein n=1 Tax=Shimia biformata TaxID=1294299 RepID=UPI00194E4287|nr:hypothetical protein [Shimia biformata]